MNRNELINQERKKRGWSIKTLSEKSGVKYNTARDIINQKTENPRIDNIEKMALALGIDLMQKEKNDELEQTFNDLRKLNNELKKDINNIIKIWLKTVQ